MIHSKLYQFRIAASLFVISANGPHKTQQIVKILLPNNLQLNNKHLEFSEVHEQFDVVVIVGNIAGIHVKHKPPLSLARSTWPDKPIIYVAGNNEFHHGDHDAQLETLRKLANETGVYLLGNEALELDDVRFISVPPRTDFDLFQNSKSSMGEAKTKIRDFREIWRLDRPFLTSDALELLNKSKQFLITELAKEFDGDTVVITQFGPTGHSIHSQWGEQPELLPYFCNDLSKLMGIPTLWIHGHTSDCIDYMVNGTRIISNPHGYYSENSQENAYFDPGLVVDTCRSILTNPNLHLKMIYKIVAVKLLKDRLLLNFVRENVMQMANQGLDVDGITNWNPTTLKDCINLVAELDTLSNIDTDANSELLINNPFECILDPEPIVESFKMYQKLPDFSMESYDHMKRFVDPSFSKQTLQLRIDCYNNLPME